jgi:polyhydroxyalkanoate synthesis regulator phasin
MMKIAGTSLGLLLLVSFTGPARAQSTTDIELTRAHIQTARQAIIAEGLPLTDDESLAFWPAYRDYRQDMARLGDRLVKVLTEFVSAGGALNAEQATRLLDDYLDIKSKEVSVKKKYVGVFRKLLPAPKVTRFFQLENKLDAVVNYDLAKTVPLTQ